MSWWSVALLCCLATVAQGQDKVSVTFLLDYSVRTFDGFFPGEYDQLKQFVLKFAESYGISADHRVSLFDVKEKESFERISCSAQQTYQQFEAQVNDLNNSESTFDSINLIKGINAAIQHLSTDACGQDGFKHYIIILTASAQYVNDPKEALTALYAQASTPTTFVLYKDDGQEERKQFAIITRGQEGAMIRVEKDYSEAQFAASILQQISGDTPAVYGEWGSYSQCNVNCQKTRSRTCNENCQNAETSQTVSCEGDQCPPTYGQWSGFSVCSSSCTQSRSRECLSSCVNIPASDRVQTQGCTGGNCVTTPVYGEWGSYSQCNVNCQKTRSRTCNENCQNAETSQTVSCEGDQCPPTYGQWSGFSVCSSSCTQSRSRECLSSCVNIPASDRVQTQGCTGGNCVTTPVYGEWGSYSQCNVNCQKTRSRTCNENCQNAETSQTVSCEGDQCPPTYGQWSGFSVCSSSCTQSRSRECLSSCVNIPASDRVQTQGCTGGNCVTTPVYGEWGSYSQCNVNCQKTRSRTCTENCQNAELSQTTSCEGDQCPPQYGEWSEFSACSTSCTQVRTRTCTRSCFFPDAALTDTRACVEGLCQATQVLTQWSGFGDCSESCNRNTPVRTRTRSCIPASLCEGVKFVDTTPCNREFNCPEYRRSDWGAWSDCSATCQNAGQIPFQVRRRDYCLEEFDTGLCSTANMIEFKNCNTEECPEVLTCENLQISFIFVMDSSASVSELQWAQEKTFVKNFVQKSELGENENVRVGIVNYGSTARIEADCNTITTKSQFNSVIDDIKRANGGTAINSGLLEAQKIYKNCQRDDEQPIIIFMTDGKENIEFDPQVIENTEADIKREAVIYAMGIANGVNSSEILRIGTNNINGETELLYRLVGGFLELSEIDPEELYPIVLGARCTLKGIWAAWGAYSTCSVFCGAQGTQLRERNCASPNNPQLLQQDCDTQGVIAKYEARTCSAECSAFNDWGEWSECSNECNQISPIPTQTRTRSCDNALGGSSCNGLFAETRQCNTNVACQGTLSGWQAFEACSDTCRMGSALPLKRRQRFCVGKTLDGDCNGAGLEEFEACNQNVPCPGVAGEWSEYGVCEASCNTAGDGPYRHRQRQCVDFSTWDEDYLGCPNIAMTSKKLCKQNEPCKGEYGEWSDWGQCSATCHNNDDINNPPTQVRTRVCQGDTLNGGCDGDSFQTQSCNVAKACPGKLTAWEDWPACPATCQMEMLPPTHTRVRNCVGGTWSGNCGEENALFETKDCSVEILCPGVLTEWTQYGACGASCNTGGNGPFMTRFRECKDVSKWNPSFEGCVNQAKSQDALCHQDVPCKGEYEEWVAWSECSQTCHNNNDPANPPSRFRTRQCKGDTLNGGCEGEKIETAPCNIQVACPGKLTAWEDWPACPATCQMEMLPPTHTRVRNCVGGTWSGNCGEENALFETKDCSVEILCPGVLTEWTEYGACGASCNTDGNGPFMTRFRECIDVSKWNPTFQGCVNQARSQDALCNQNVPCKGEYDEWSDWGQCSATCHNNDDINNPPTQVRSRVCQGDTLNGGCDGDSFQTQSCNVAKACPGKLTAWEDWPACPATCQMEMLPPTHTRVRNCVGGTWSGNCGEENALFETKDCSVEILCPGVLTEWTEYGACGASCNTGGNGPFMTRFRECKDVSKWNPSFEGCVNQAKSQDALCHQDVPCKGEYEEWLAWSECSETCHNNNDPANPPSRFRTRQCKGDTLNGGCEGENIETAPCNIQVACPGKLTAWEDWPACPATCQMEMLPPTHTRVRNCVGGTWSGNCGEENALFETKDCSVEILCPGVLTEWTEYGACGASCNTAGNGPFMTRFRECIDVSKWNPSFQGCVNQPRSEDRACHQNVPCKGLYKEWSTWSTCTETCQSDPNNLPTQFRTRVCEGDTLGGGCEGDASESQTCSVNVPCPGVLTQWSDFTQCSHDCHPDDIESPTRQRTRQCLTATLGANCGGAALLEVENCNFQEPCQGQITQWSEWTACPATCQPAFEEFLHQYRSRVCEDNTHGGDCFNKKTNQEKRCVENLPCPGVLTQWSEFTQCSESCQSDVDVIPTQKRTRVCLDATLNANCNNALLEEIVECSKHVGCPGIWTEWGPFTDCSHTCQSSADLVPSKWRQRFCTGRTFDGLCPAEGDVTAVQTIQCNAAVVCPVIGTWSKWSDWSECSETCDNGITKRMRTCSESFGTGETDCEGDAEEEQVCNLGDCPKVCPIGKRCSCNAAKVWNFVPSFNQFAEGEVTVENVNAAVDYLNHYTPDVVNQTCAACNKMRLQSVINQLESHLSSLRLVRDHLEAAKDEMRDVLNCNQVIGNYVGLWELYDFMYQRCAMLNGVEIELNAIHARFETALETCESYGWFHRLLRKVWSKM